MVKVLLRIDPHLAPKNRRGMVTAWIGKVEGQRSDRAVKLRDLASDGCLEGRAGPEWRSPPCGLRLSDIHKPRQPGN